MPLTIVVAAVAAVAILLIAVGVASSGRGSGVSARLERYASGRERDQEDRGQHVARRPHLPERGDLAAQQGRRAARLRGQPRARPGAGRPEAEAVSEFLGIWAAVDRRRARLHVPASASSCPALQNPIIAPGGRRPRLHPAASGTSSAARASRLNAFNKQLPDTITLIANALRAGSSFLQAIELVVRESRPPISTEFARVIREVNLGLPFEAGPGEHGPPRPLGRPRADGHGHLHPAHGRRQPRRDPRLDRVHDPRAGPDQGRDPHPDRPAAHVGLRRGFLPIGLAGFLFVVAPSFIEPDVRTRR